MALARTAQFKPVRSSDLFGPAGLFSRARIVTTPVIGVWVSRKLRHDPSHGVSAAGRLSAPVTGRLRSASGFALGQSDLHDRLALAKEFECIRERSGEN